MKIALPTEDGNHICGHFDRAFQFVVVNIEVLILQVKQRDEG